MMCSQSEYSAPCRQSSRLLEFCCRPSRSPLSNLTSLIGHFGHTSLTLCDFRFLISPISCKLERLSTEHMYKICSLYSKLFLLFFCSIRIRAILRKNDNFLSPFKKRAADWSFGLISSTPLFLSRFPFLPMCANVRPNFSSEREKAEETRQRPDHLVRMIN